MSVEISFPLEFIVEGVALSLQAKKVKSKQAWKDRIQAAAKRRLPEGHWAAAGPLAVTIFYFPDTAMEGDIDNIVKPILDALCKFVYLDDAQVARILVEKFEPDRVFAFSAPSPCLADAVDQIGPRVYIRIETA